MPLTALMSAKTYYDVTPSDTVSQPGILLYVGGTGNVTLMTTNGQTVLFAGAPAGQFIPATFARVMATGTTATNLVAMGP
jgi:hypothetical protein